MLALLFTRLNPTGQNQFLKRTKPVEIFKDIFWTGLQCSHLHHAIKIVYKVEYSAV